jgi:hypothetical protein
MDIASGLWNRDLDDDLEIIIVGGANALVSLIGSSEDVLLNAPDFPEKVLAVGISRLCQILKSVI